jgi:hypothetical protein
VTPRTRTAVVFAVVATVVVTGFTVSRRHDERLRREGYAKAQKFKDDIDHRFPAGTLRAQFMEFADKWSGWHGDSGSSHWISVGQVPSQVWYCGPWEVGVVVSFAQDRVSATRVDSWSLNCP